MTQEEKAKAYDEVVNKLKGFMTQGVDPLITRADVQDFFPELKESEDERIRKAIIKLVDKHPDGTMEMLSWLEKQGEQKSADGPKKVKGKLKKITFPGWSEEDEIYANTIRSIIYYNCDAEVASGAITWLESLKDRAVPQPKQEWSEEDERIRIETIELLETANHPNKMRSNGKPLDFTENINWLKSLRPQTTWKPSDEQIKALLKLEEMHVLEHEKNQENAHLYMVIKSIREQLLKLR